MERASFIEEPASSIRRTAERGSIRHARRLFDPRGRPEGQFRQRRLGWLEGRRRKTVHPGLSGGGNMMDVYFDDEFGETVSRPYCLRFRL